MFPSQWSHAERAEAAGGADGDSHVRIGALNQGRRIDYVLQESSTESVTPQLFAMRAHTNYWTSEDTVLFMLTKIYVPES